MNINDLIEHLEGVRRDWGPEVEVELEYRPWLLNNWNGTTDYDIDVSDEAKKTVVLVWGDDDEGEHEDTHDYIRAEQEAQLDAMEAHYGIEPSGWQDSY